MSFGRNRSLRWCWIAALALLLGAATAVSAQQPSTPSVPTTAQSQIDPAHPYSLPPAKLTQAIALGKIRTLIHFGAEFWQLAVLSLLLVTGSASCIGQWAAAQTARGWLQTLIFATILSALIFIAVDLPIDAVGHAFSLHYRISVEGWLPWLLDQGKTLALTVLLETPLLMLALTLMRRSPRHYWFWFAAATVPISLLVVFLLPPLVEPLFYDFEPLAQSHPALVEQLQQVVARTGASIPPSRMFLMKASEKSNGLNAYVSGLGASKRIVVWDTTADRMPADEILFTFAHESGHYVLNHIAKGLALGAVGMFALFWAVARFAEALVRRFGERWRVSTVASLPGLAVLVLSLSMLQIVTEPIENTISRHFEHEADIYGQEAIHGLVSNPQKTAVAAFQALGEAYLEDPNPNTFLEFWSYDHPSIQTRARFAAQYNPWAAGHTPQFFSK